MASERRLTLYPIDTAARARMVDAYSAGARVLRVSSLRGGLDALTQSLDLEHSSGRREKVVLRAYPAGRQHLTSETARREFRTIELAQRAGVPSAQPLFLDAEGAYLGAPAMLLSYLRGRPMYRLANAAARMEDLARAIHLIHAVTPRRFDLSWLPRNRPDELASELEEMRDPALAHDDAITAEAFATLEASMDRLRWPEPCLIHGDFWPGNTIWYRGKVAGVIDWSDAALGDPRLDVSQCRVDVLLVCGEEAGDALVAAYESLAGRPLQDLVITDLLKGLRAMLNYKVWLAIAEDTGLAHLTEEIAGKRLRAFLEPVLREVTQTS